MKRCLSLRVASPGILVFLVATAFSHDLSYILLPVTSQDVLPQLFNGSDFHHSLQELREVMSYLPQCAKTDQINELKTLLRSVGDCSFLNMQSGTKTVTFIAPSSLPQLTLEDVAMNKLSYQSSTAIVEVPSKAIDGNDVSHSHTLHEPFPWWMVDLGAERTIRYIEIRPRIDCCYERYHDVELRIGNTLQTNGDFSSHTLLNFYKGPYSIEQGSLLYSFGDGIIGRYLSIKIVSQSNEYLHLATVKAFALKN